MTDEWFPNMTFAMIAPSLTLLIALLVCASFRFSSYPKSDLVLDSVVIAS